MMKVPDKVVVAEVGPRDGFQSFARWISTEDKITIVDLLSDAGLPVIEVTSFAHPKVVPGYEGPSRQIRLREGLPNMRGPEARRRSASCAPQQGVPNKDRRSYEGRPSAQDETERGLGTTNSMDRTTHRVA